jgi:hypothetical protein
MQIDVTGEADDVVDHAPIGDDEFVGTRDDSDWPDGSEPLTADDDEPIGDDELIGLRYDADGLPVREPLTGR